MISTPSGHCLVTWADCTSAMRSTRLATAPVFTRISGSPAGMPAAASTCDLGTRRVPVTLTVRTARNREPSSSHTATAMIPAAASAKNAVRYGLGPRLAAAPGGPDDPDDPGGPDGPGGTLVAGPAVTSPLPGPRGAR